MKTNLYLTILIVAFTSVAYGKVTNNKRPLIINNTNTFNIERILNFKIAGLEATNFDQRALKLFMTAPSESIQNKEFYSSRSQEKVFQNQTFDSEIPQYDLVQGTALIDIEYESTVIINNRYASLNVNSDLFIEPLVISPSLGFSIMSVLYEHQVNSNLNVQFYTQPRMYCLSYESSSIDEENNALFDFHNPSRSLEFFTGEINLGIVLQSNDFSIEYSRTTDFNEWGEIELVVPIY